MGISSLNPLNPVNSNVQLADKLIDGASNIPNMNQDDWGHAVGYGSEKIAEGVLISKGAGLAKSAIGELGAAGITNPIPSTLARVVPNIDGITTLGAPGAGDVFVTAASDIRGLTASQIASKLTIPESSLGYKVFEFKTPQFGLSTPINRTNPGFVGFGRTAGGAREFSIPNQVIPAGSNIRVVQ